MSALAVVEIPAGPNICDRTKFIYLTSKYIPMKPIISILGAIAAIALFPHIAQASAYKTSSRTTFIQIKELPGDIGSAIGTGYYRTYVGGREWAGGFQATSVTSSGGIRTYTGTFTDEHFGPDATQQCKGNLKLQRPVSNSGPAPLTASWTITGGVNCPSRVGSIFKLNLTEAVPVANSSGNFLASNANTIESETAGSATWPKWVVTDPTGLNCRATAPSGPIVKTFPNGSTIDVQNQGLNSFITAGGASWLRVTNSPVCFIRANSQYIKPKLMPF